MQRLVTTVQSRGVKCVAASESSRGDAILRLGGVLTRRLKAGVGRPEFVRVTQRRSLRLREAIGRMAVKYWRSPGLHVFSKHTTAPTLQWHQMQTLMTTFSSGSVSAVERMLLESFPKWTPTYMMLPRALGNRAAYVLTEMSPLILQPTKEDSSYSKKACILTICVHPLFNSSQHSRPETV